MDLRTFSAPQIPVIFVYFLPCILDSDNPYAGNLLSILSEKKYTKRCYQQTEINNHPYNKQKKLRRAPDHFRNFRSFFSFLGLYG